MQVLLVVVNPFVIVSTNHNINTDIPMKNKFILLKLITGLGLNKTYSVKLYTREQVRPSASGA